MFQLNREATAAGKVEVRVGSDVAKRTKDRKRRLRNLQIRKIVIRFRDLWQFSLM
jgi:hypothetical protein